MIQSGEPDFFVASQFASISRAIYLVLPNVHSLLLGQQAPVVESRPRFVHDLVSNVLLVLPGTNVLFSPLLNDLINLVRTDTSSFQLLLP